MRLSDIIISNLVVPSSSILGGQFPVSWTVTNQGSEATESSFWYDEIYFSVDEILDEEDYSLFRGWVRNPLKSNGSYEITQNITLPGEEESGTGYLIFATDRDNQESEIDETNNVYVVPIELNTPDIDLKTIDANVPNTAILNRDSIEVSFTVANQGTDTVVANNLYDYIYLSEDNIFDEDDIFLNSISTANNLPLAPGNSYTSTTNITLPTNQGIGDRYLLFVADEENRQRETNENNNVYAAPIALNPPNLIDDLDFSITDVTVPTTAFLSEKINVAWTVTNQGTETIPFDYLADYIYLSEDNIFDEDDVFLNSTSTTNNFPLAPGTSYTATTDITLPNHAGAGDRYLLFVVDRDNRHWETNENNNVYAAPIELNIPNVDFIVTDATVPTTAALNGESIEVSFTVTNQGTEVTTSEQIYDFIYLSEDDTFDENDTYIGFFYTDDNLPIASGSSYTATTNVTLPNNVGVGDRYILFVADESNYQSEIDETNNVYAAPIELNIPDVDLAITSAIAPATATLSEEIEVSWTVANQGTETALGSFQYNDFYYNRAWYDSIYLSEDEIFDEKDTNIYQQWNNSYTPLAGNNSYTYTQNIRIPSNTKNGEQYLLFVADSNEHQAEADETNNVYSLPIELNLPDVDLAITNVISPSLAHRGETIELSWTVANQGTEATSSYFSYELTDGIYLSKDEIFDSSDRFVSSFPVGDKTPLAGGDNYTATENVNIPTNIEPGQYYLFLATDFSEKQAETDRANNIWRSNIEIGTDGANLVVSDVNAPTEATLSETIEVSWTVSNQGGVATPDIDDYYYSNSYDNIYISDDEILDDSDTFVTRQSSRENHPLTGGDSYSVTQNISIPNTASGDRYLLFVADGNNYIWETNQNDNTQAVPIFLREPDVNLVITDATAPTATPWGETIELSWTVANQGTETALAQEWYDYVYLSDDEILDDLDTYVTSYFAADDTPLEAGESYTTIQNISLPQTRTGDRYLLFAVDRNDRQSETNQEDNVLALPIALRDPDIDLEITNTTTPVSAKKGDIIELSWTVTNQGSDPTNTSFWYDYVYLSDDEVLDDNDNYLTNFYTGNETPIASGESYTQTQNVFLSNDLDIGDRFLIFAADRNNHQVETDETNNFVAVPFQLTVPDVDLAITNPIAPASANKGDTIELSWTVTNQGNEPTNTSFWYDYVYLSDDEVLDDNDDYLTEFYIAGEPPLAAGESYTQTQNVFLSNELDIGDRFLIFAADKNNNQSEIDETNNFISVPFKLNEPDRDLAITNIVAPTTALRGETIDISWLDNNLGTLSIDGTWYDRLYLSVNDVAGDNDDIYLNEFYYQNEILAGQSEARSQQVTLPVSLAEGNYHLYLEGDTYNYITEVDETNNITFLSQTIDISSPDVDLTVSDISAPATGVRGQYIDLSWTVNNQGSEDATSYWYDNIYLSTNDIAGDDDDVSIQTIYYSEEIVAGGSRIRTAQVYLPNSVDDGNYHLVVETDTFNYLAEKDETNNKAIATDIIALSSPDLIVANITAPLEGLSGEDVDITWTVTNQGTVAATGSWYDTIYFSEDPDNSFSDRWLGEFLFEGTIEPGESITRTQTITLPIDLQGEGVIRVDSDRYNNLVESDENNNSRVSEQPFTSVLSPYPNLVVGEVTAPNNIFSGQRVPIEWTVNNTGAGATNASYWYDAVWLSLDNVIDSSDTYLGQVRNASYLESGQGYSNRLTVTLPKQAEGNYQFLVQTDSSSQVFENENENDNSGFSNAVNIEPSPAPDLQVTTVNGATQAFSGQQSTVSYTVTNEGEGRATGSLFPIYERSGNSRYEVYTQDSGWTDYIYISADEVLDDDDDIVGSYRRSTDYEVFITETITRHYANDYIDGLISGFESITETNTYESLEDSYWAAHWYIDRIAGYDNQLEGLTDSWTRYQKNHYAKSYGIYSNDTYEYDIEITPIPASLEPGESYSVSQDVTLPIGISGDYHILVKSDRNNEVDELTFETNNTGFDPNPTKINLTPPPDLEVAFINAPTEALASHELIFNYRIANFGSTVTPNSSWQDAFYLSADNQLDTETDLYLGNAYHDGQLQAGDSYEREVTFTLPNEINGDYYLFIATDKENEVFELDNNNNIRFHNETIAIASRPADLVVSSFVAPETTEAGKGLLVEWTVENQGTGDTAVDAWSDRLIASTDEVLGNEDDVILRTFNHNGLLDVGDSYTLSQTVNIPFELLGNYNLFLVSDTSDRVYEAAAEDNSVLLPITITRETADLQITQVTAADTAQSGKSLNVNWTVKNLGTAPTNSNNWYDEVFLSPDLTLGNGNDISLGRIWRSDILEPDEEYTVSRNLSVPEDLEGNYHVIVKTDSPNSGDRGSVIEDGGEDNNEAIVSNPTAISLSPVPDLVIENIEAPTEGVSGQSFSLTWTVRNNGAEDINNEWRTAIYLSRDQVFDRSSDTYIGYATQQGNPIPGESPEDNSYSLAAGESVTQTQSFRIPNGLSGALYAFAVIDSGEKIYERDGESNNVGFDGNSMQVILPPPADLVVGTITIPENGVPGQEATIEYLVENQGDNAAVGNWADSIYISANPEWDVNDPLFGKAYKAGPVESGESYTNSLTAALPGITPGEYYVIVRSDIRNAIAEPDETNNIDASENTFPADAEVLELATPITGELGAGRSNYYRIDVEAGETLKVNFDSESDFAANELYLSYGEVPTRSNYDFGFDDPLAADQEIVVPNTRAGSYYVLAYGNISNDYTIEAEVLDFSLLDIGTDSGSNVGRVTTTVLGAEFTPETEVSLVLPDGSDRLAAEVRWKDNAELWATFDLEGLEPGQYDVKVQDGTETAVLEDKFTVTNGAPGDVQVTMNIPPALRPGQQGVATIKYINTGETDVIAPLITLAAENANLRSPDGTNTSSSELQFLGINFEGPAGILSPGASGTINVVYEPTIETGSVGFSLSQIKKPNDPFDLSSFKESLRPDGIIDEDWNNIWQNFINSVGKTAGDYNTSLAENSTHLSLIGSQTNDVAQLLNFELLQASGYGSLIGRNKIGLLGRNQLDFPLLKLRAIRDENGDVTITDSEFTISFDLQEDGTYLSDSITSSSLNIEDNQLKLSDSSGNIFAFRDDGYLDFIEGSDGNRLQTTFSNGLLTALTGSDGSEIIFEYNDFGRISRIVTDLEEYSFSYDSTGEYLLSGTTPSGTIQYSYETSAGPAQGAIRSITQADGTQQVFDYDSFGRLISQGLSDGYETLTYEYDSTGIITVTDALGGSRQKLFNDSGQLGRSIDALGGVTQYRYDSSGNLVEIVLPDGTSTFNEYDDFGNLSSLTDALGNTVEFTYNRATNLLETVQDSLGNTTVRYTHDDQGNITSTTYADGSVERFTYDTQGNQVEIVNRRGQSIQLLYNDQNQLIQKIWDDGTQFSFIYNNEGYLVSITDPQGITSLEYDSNNSLTKIIYPNGRFLTYTYDIVGRRTQLVNQDGFTINYTYNDRGRIASLTDGNDETIVAYSYDEAGRLIREDKGNETYTTYAYDIAGQITSIVNYAPDSTINSRFDYTYNNQGLRDSMNTMEGLWQYDYNSIGQLTSVTSPSGRVIDYRYDTSGNRVTVTDDGIQSDYTSNNLNQYTRAGDVDFTYDTNGNLSSKTVNGQIWTYDYNIENRLIGVDGPDGSWIYEYDALGNRVATVRDGQRTEYLVDPFGISGLADIIEEYDQSGNLLANYVHGIGLETRVDSTDSATYFDFDVVGSTVGLTDSSGSYLNEYSYLPFGEELTKTEAVDNSFEYVGQWGVMDEGNGLDFMRFRFFDTNQGRFISPDPLGLAAGSTNLYQYTDNNPISFIDPSGLFFAPDSILPPELLREMDALEATTLEDIKKSLEKTIKEYIDEVCPNQSTEGILDIIAGSLGLSSAAGSTALVKIVFLSVAIYAGGSVAAVTAAGAASLAVTVAAGAGAYKSGKQIGKGIDKIISDFNGQQSSYYDPSNIKNIQGIVKDKVTLDKLTRSVVKTLNSQSPVGKKDLLVAAAEYAKDKCKHPDPEDLPDDPEQDGDPLTDDTDIVAPLDPNDILGPDGFGEERWISALETLPYTIRFENQATATAPAQEVTITHPLDDDVDFRSFRLGNFGWGEYYFEVPENSAFYQERLDLTEEQGFLIDVVAGVDVAEGEAFWTITTIDPETGEIPEDALAGFLPPNNDEGVGDGFVSYTIKPSPDAETGDIIDAEATIIFDTEEPIDTPPIFNTIDADAPNSTVAVLPEISSTEDFLVKWSGHDEVNGSALAGYDVYVADNGGEFTLWLENTTLTEATYKGEPGHIYRFYTIATDNAGNRQAIPAEAQAVIRVAGGEPPVVTTNQVLTLDEGATDVIAASLLEITDPDNPATEISYTLTDLPDNGVLSLDGDNFTLDISFTQEDIDNNLLSYQHDGGETTSDSFSFTASDFSGNSIDLTTFNIDITPVDDAPVVQNKIADLTVNEDGENTVIDLSNVFSDIDNDDTAIVKTIFANNNESLVTAKIEDNNLILDYQENRSGMAEITIQAESNTKIVQDSFMITVNPVNDAPTLANKLPSLVATEDELFSFTIPDNTFTDIESANNLTYTITLEDGSPLPNWLTFNPDTKTLSGTPKNGDVASLNLKVIATDSDNETVSDIFTLTVENVDDAPVVQNEIADLTVNEDGENTVIDLSNVFSDIDNDDTAIVKTIFANNNENLVTAKIENNNLILDYQDDRSGMAEITIQAESNTKIVQDSFVVTVNPVNDAPTLANKLPSLVATEDELFSFTIPDNTFTDVESANNLTYTITLEDGSPLPNWLTFNPDSKTLSGTSKNGDAGISNLRVIAADSNGATAEDVFSLKVQALSELPILSLSNLVARQNADTTMSLTLSNVEAVNQVEFEFVYDTNLLDIKAIAIDKNLPESWKITDSQIDEDNGIVKVTLEGRDPLTGSNLNLTNFDVSIPENTNYGASQSLELQAVKLNSQDVDINPEHGTQVIAQPGDMTGNGNLSGLDIYQVLRLAVGLDTNVNGFTGIESSIIADINQDGVVSAFDAYLAYSAIK